MSLAFAIALVLAVGPSEPGAYLMSDAITDSSHPNFNVSINRIVHPRNYTGTGGPISLKVCISGATALDMALEPPLQRAIATINALTPSNTNYSDAGNPSKWDAETIVLHELGHCALGLDHPNHDQYPLYARSVRDTNSPFDADGVPGNEDDIHRPPPNFPDKALNLNFYRKSDNNPFAIDATVIDGLSYKRAITPSNLPSGHNWSVLGSIFVAVSKGIASSHSMMMPLTSESVVRELNPDDVNMVKRAMAGLDDTAGNADDYVLTVSLVEDCQTADIEVEFAEIPNTSRPGRCSAIPEQIMDEHYRVQGFGPGTLPKIELNSLVDWHFGIGIHQFTAGFEGGDLEEWSTTSP